MQHLIRRIGLLAAVLLLSINLSASHLLGGEITWECANNGDYIFTLVLYRECGSVPFNPATLASSYPINGAATFTVNRISITEVSPDCIGGTLISCATSQSGKGAVEAHVYKSGLVSLSGVPPASGWEFYFSLCCRPGTVVNGPSNANYYLRAKMYPYTPVGATAPLSANNCYDNSPYFAELGTLTQIKGSPFTYNHLAADKEVDSLFVKFADPLTAVGTSVNWASGYASNRPYPNPSVNSAHGPITIDGTSGSVSMDVADNAPTGSYASCYAIEAWKCGQTPNGPGPQKVAEIFRDVAIIFQDFNSSYKCATDPATWRNDEPDAFIDTAVYTNINQLNAKTYQTSVYPGDTIAFQFSASDFDKRANCTFQDITFRAEGLQASDPMGSGSGCNGVAPCATFTPKAGQSGYTNPLNNDINFFWVPDCPHLTFGGSACSPSSRFVFSLRMEDDFCPAPEISLTTFIVDVIIGDPIPINFSCVEVDPLTGELILSWERSRHDSALEFNNYVIMAATSFAGPFDTIQYIGDIDSLSTTVAPDSGYQHFFIYKSTGKCDFFSMPSDTISVMDLSLTATPPNNAEVASLNWSALRSPLPWMTTGYYEVWQEAPAGSGRWKMVGQTTGRSYSDTVTVCGDTVNYQIRVTDTLVGCVSASDIEAAFFSDQTNNDKLVIDSVSVNQANRSIISWQPTAYGDVVAYYLYFNDPKLGWVIVDTIPLGTAMPWEWTGSKAASRSEEFRVSSVDSCDNQSDYQLVKPHESIYLRAYLNKCEAYARISWNSYEGFGREAIAGYQVLLQTTDHNNVSSAYQTLFVSKPEDTAYTQWNLQNGYTYCYRVRAIDTSGALSSTSNEICIQAEVPNKSKILYLAQVTYMPNREALGLNTLIDGNADVEDFSIERAPDREGPWQLLGRVGKPGQAPYLVNFLDFSANPGQNIYYYRVSATDSCGGRDTVSNLGRNILLTVEDRPNLSNLLRWNAYEDWDGEVGTYSIYRMGPEETRFSRVKDVAGVDTFFVDNIEDYRGTEGNFCYYVVATEVGNSLGIVGPDGLPYTSRSNQVCMNQPARIFVPTAFRPGSEYAENRRFGPSARFVELEAYTFYVMNRWGVKIFETNDPDEHWDGNDGNEPAAQGTYIYYLRYKTPGGRTEEERGSFTLIR